MNRNAIHLGACAALLVFAGVACGSGDDTDSAAEAPQTSATETASPVADAPAGGPTITIKLIAFKPTDIQVAAGGTVTWRHVDVATHTVTSGPVEQIGGTAVARH